MTNRARPGIPFWSASDRCDACDGGTLLNGKARSCRREVSSLRPWRLGVFAPLGYQQGWWPASVTLSHCRKRESCSSGGSWLARALAFRERWAFPVAVSFVGMPLPSRRSREDDWGEELFMSRWTRGRERGGIPFELTMSGLNPRLPGLENPVHRRGDGAPIVNPPLTRGDFAAGQAATGATPARFRRMDGIGGIRRAFDPKPAGEKPDRVARDLHRIVVNV